MAGAAGSSCRLPHGKLHTGFSPLINGRNKGTKVANVSRPSPLEDLKQALLTPQGPPCTTNLGAKEACGALWRLWAPSLLLRPR